MHNKSLMINEEIFMIHLTILLRSYRPIIVFVKIKPVFFLSNHLFLLQDDNKAGDLFD